MLLAALDQTIVATAMPTIGLALGDAANLPWIVTAYLLTTTVTTPKSGATVASRVAHSAVRTVSL